MTAPSPRPDVLAALDQLDALLVPSLPIPPADSDAPAGDDERTSLVMDALWDDSDYPDFSQRDVLRAYRLGAEDQRALHYARLSALPQLTDAVRAVHALAEKWAGAEDEAGCPEPRFRYAADRLCAVLAALTPDTTTEKASTQA